MKTSDIAWRAVLRGYGISIAGTLVLGLPAFLAQHNVWWIALAGVLSLFGACFVTAYSIKNAEPLNGAFVAVFYFATMVAVIFLGELTGKLPDPLPGLPRGDSTFFFVSPLGQLVASTLGTLLGGKRRG